MRSVRPLYIPPLKIDHTESGLLIMRDGSTAAIRPAEPTDASLMQQFVDRLSPESRRHRFFSETLPSRDRIVALCDSSTPDSQLTLIVTRMQEGSLQIIATGSYWAKDADTAEAAMVVDDAFHGKGLGTLLLERLALLAIHHGFTRLWAVTHAENLAMREVFRESGFTAHEAYEGDDMAVELSLIPTETTVARAEVRERLATTASLRPFFQPRSVAIIGASRNPNKIGYRLLDAITAGRFRGAVYPVNPQAAGIKGIRTYRSLLEIPEPIDLAVIAVPRDSVLPVIDECAAKGIRACVIITAGFAEVGREGAALQQQVVTKVRQHGMRMIGPNCFGILNTDPNVQLNATFTTLFPPQGHAAMSSQSGAIGIATLAGARRFQLGISSFVSVGNKADVSTNDLLQYWEEDPATNVILVYVESLGNPRRFARIARRVSRCKPIVAVKAGRTKSGRRAASSHTAALAASDVAVDALFHQAGVIRAESLDDMLSLAAGLSAQPLPPGRRVGIITNAGGPAILCTDACEADALVVPELSDRTKATLASFLPSAAALSNPVDLIASATPDQYAKAIETLLSAEEIDALIILYISVTVTDTADIAHGIIAGIENGRKAGAKTKPVLIGWMAEGDRDRTFRFHTETIPAYHLPETPALVLSKAASYGEWRQQRPGMVPDFDDLDLSAARQICADALSRRGDGWLTTEERRNVLRAIRLPVQPGGVAKTADEAAALARQAGYPVAVKLASYQIVHKTEIGGVQLNLANDQAVRKAFESIRTRLAETNQLGAMEGVLVQPMLTGGVEVMIGVTEDPLFGPLIAFGLGGIHVEILGDVQFRITPLTDLDAEEMIRGIKGYRLLTGYRGHPPADLEALEETLLRVSRLAEEIPEISELDLNPIFALPPGKGCRIVDARIRVG
ncbi:bifunctional acetate--CoA ligase family protein/GNAT family N-acetyltransferase [Candidatus Nitrospira nitrificans]|uniref:Putative Acyl-CoA synthetase (NDP forming) n=1 Tax=Candidatus Nitrospira nitrificans TaxID=1742973 RepID=A0A0S4LGL9_9BACT|nr:GNAT family N-acetyltransferase [Candidatus Nitrospira nitrificans]CUS35126.1 putative Acyl-CoA synthetase (NDP forming) [Candidatus Nitrospira nitrificans]